MFLLVKRGLMKNSFLMRVRKIGLLGLALLVFAMPAHAQNNNAQNNARPDDYVTSLNEDNIRGFLKEVGDISTGQRADMLNDDVIDYFNNHMADRGKFKSTMRYEIPGFPTHDTEMKLDKEQYINTIVNGRHMMEDYQSTIDIQDLKISGNGKSATFTSVITEKGKMPFPKDPKKPNDVDIVPIEGKSKCDQRVIISYNNFIQMAGAACQTIISFDPFGGKPLIPQ